MGGSPGPGTGPGQPMWSDICRPLPTSLTVLAGTAST